MASSARTAVTLLVGLGGFSLACLGAVAFIGKQVDDAQVSVGHVITPEELLRRVEEQRRIYEAMSPAQHLETARELLATRYDIDEGNIGPVEAAEHHLQGVPAGSAARAEVAPLEAEIARRRVAFAHFAGDQVVRIGRGLEASTDPRVQQTQRHEIATVLDHRPALGCVHDVGEAGTVLRFDNGACNEAFLSSVSAEPARGVLRRVGFRSVQCRVGQPPYAFVP